MKCLILSQFKVFFQRRSQLKNILGACILGGVIIIGIPKTAFSLCEEAFKKMQKAKAEMDAAWNILDRAGQDFFKAEQDLDAVTKNFNAVAAGLGAAGKATRTSATFGRSPTNPTFFEDAKYKAAKAAWQAAKDKYGEAQKKLNTAEENFTEAQKKFEAAKDEYLKMELVPKLRDGIDPPVFGD